MLKAHPFAEAFPLITGEAFADLVEDIREHGIRDAIVMLDREILDGRNRYAALNFLVESGEVLGEGWGHRAGEPLAPEALDPPQLWFSAFNRAINGDPLAWVVSKNLKRRHLDESQRGLVAGRIATMRQGERTDLAEPSANLPKVSTAAAAKALNVSERQVTAGRKVAQQGTEDLQRAVESGAVSLSTAEAVASLPADEQAEIVARGEKEILQAAKGIRSRQRQVRFDQVNERLAKISEGNAPLPTGRKYPIIYADPATKYVSGFGDRSIENHYPTMTTEELCALPVRDIAADDAMLQIWSTVPQLANTMKIIEAWGFKYVSCLCWDKVLQGTGHWAFNQHEVLLIATRGNFPAPVPGQQPRSLHREERTDHSVKPAWFAEQIERIWPMLPKIELFTRNARPGWDVWGNQSESQAKSDVDLAATEGALAPAAEGMNDAESRLAAGRTADAAGDASALSAARIPGEGASGTAREAPSTGCGTSAETSNVGPQAAPPHVSFEAVDTAGERDEFAPGEVVELPESFRLGQPAPRPEAARADDGLDIPAFLRRDANNVPGCARTDA